MKRIEMLCPRRAALGQARAVKLLFQQPEKKQRRVISGPSLSRTRDLKAAKMQSIIIEQLRADESAAHCAGPVAGRRSVAAMHSKSSIRECECGE